MNSFKELGQNKNLHARFAVPTNKDFYLEFEMAEEHNVHVNIMNNTSWLP